MNSEHVKLYIRIVDAGSFTKAQEDSFLSKQAMYKQINKLEEEIGCTLLERTKQGIKPTKAGNYFYQQAKKIIKLEENTIRECRNFNQSEMIRTGNVEHQVILDPVNTAFALAYPEIPIHKIVHPNHSGEYRVHENIMDVGETFHPLGLQHLKNGYTPLIIAKFHIAMKQDHPLSKKQILSLSDISAYKTIIFPIMLEKEHLVEIEEAFQKKPSNLVKRKDIDNQVDAAFSCIQSNQLFLTANPFIRKIHELKCIPLETKFQREYGIIYKDPPGETVQKYINTAIQVYQNINDSFFTKLP